MSTKDIDIFHIVEKRRQKSVNRLIEARKNEKLNQTEVAESLNIDRSTLSKWENTKGTPSVDDYFQLSVLYKKPVDYLMALDVILESGIKITSDKGVGVNEELDHIEYEANELLRKRLPSGSNLEDLRASVRLIQSFLKGFQNHSDD